MIKLFSFLFRSAGNQSMDTYYGNVVGSDKAPGPTFQEAQKDFQRAHVRFSKASDCQ